MANKFLLHFPPEAIRAALSQNPSEPYSELAATVSIALDIDLGRSKSIRDYARIWHWNRGKVHREMPGLKKDAEDWLSWYGKKGETSRDSSVTAVGQQRDSRVTKKQRKSNISDAERDNVVTAVGQSCDNGVTQTIQNSELQNSDNTDSLTSFEKTRATKNGIDSDSKRKPDPPNSRRVRNIDDLVLDVKDYAWCAEKCPGVDADAMLEELKDWVLKKRKNRYDDYRSGWRTFCRTAYEKIQSRPKGRKDKHHITAADMHQTMREADAILRKSSTEPYA